MKTLFLVLLEWCEFLFTIPSSWLDLFNNFSKGPEFLVVLIILLLSIFVNPSAFISFLATRLFYSSRRLLDILLPGPDLVAANLFHFRRWDCRGVNNARWQAVNLNPANVYLLFPPTQYRNVRNFQMLMSFPPSPSLTASSAFLRSSPKLSVKQSYAYIYSIFIYIHLFHPCCFCTLK